MNRMKVKKASLLREAKKLDASLKTSRWALYQDLLKVSVDYLRAVREEDSHIDTWLESLPSEWDKESFYLAVVGLELQKYSSRRVQFGVNQLIALVKKHPHWIEVLNRPLEDEALANFHAVESRLSLLNDGLRHHRVQPFLLSELRNDVAKLLGHCDRRENLEGCDFGAGASIGVHGNTTNLRAKLDGKWTCTPESYYHARDALSQHSPIWTKVLGGFTCDYVGSQKAFAKAFRTRVSWVNHNKISFVPKTATSLRLIAVEPVLNGYLQKGVDVVLRRKLLQWGIDLSMGQTINSDMARLGSFDEPDGYVTIDLKNASDSISVELVRGILPSDWFALLDDMRPKYGLLPDGVKHRFEKFCSMGNGFCFPLQTLIFAAFCRNAGAVKGEFAVYGDDIIVRKSCLSKLLSTLAAFGFEVNARKSFTEGPFRESCGSDWYYGENIRPAVLNEWIDNVESLIKFFNLSQRNSYTFHLFWSWRDRVLCNFSCYALPRSFNSEVTDGALWVEYDTLLASPYCYFNRKLQRTEYLAFHRKVVEDRVPPSSEALLLAALRGASSEAPFAKRYTLGKRRVVICGVGGSAKNWIPQRWPSREDLVSGSWPLLVTE
jgi:hypothetical protein